MVINKVIKINPHLAKTYLDYATKNRSINSRHVEYLANEMREGRWLFNGSPIRFNIDGKLMDGQHRLRAVISSGKTYDFVVIEGLEDEVFITIDTGQNARKVSQLLFINDEKYTTIKAGAATWLYRYQQGNITKTKPRTSPKEILDILDMYPALREYAPMIANLEIRFLSNSLLLMLYAQFCEKSKRLADEYIHYLVGLDLSKNNPVYLLRERLLRDKLSKSRLPDEEKCALAIKAWNYLRRGRYEIGVLKYTNNVEEFPKIE